MAINQLLQKRQRVTVEDVVKHRASQAKWAGGVAAKADIDAFKCKKDRTNVALKFDHYFSRETTSRKPSPIKAAARFLADPELISLGGGFPSSDFYPISRMSMTVPHGEHFTPAEVEKSNIHLSSGKADISAGVSALDLSVALNYGVGGGTPALLRWLTEHTEICHDPPYQDWSLSMTIGNTSALDICLRMLADYGDYMLTERYAFASAISAARAQGVTVLGIPMDAEGLLPDAMDEILTSWDPEAYGGARKPRLLYTVPSGQNPTGTTQSTYRRQAVYRVAQKHNIIILEDDPYYFLQMQPYHQVNGHEPPQPRTSQEFLDALEPSLLSLDTDGRVLRFDSVSKVIAPGARVGWITGQKRIIDMYIQSAEFCTQAPSGFSQIALYKLLDEYWGHEGFFSWLRHIRAEYSQRRNVILAACAEYLPREVASWVPPMAGMFLWIQIDWEKHPRASLMSFEQLEEDLFMQCVHNHTLLARGSWFKADLDATGHEDMFFRATFCAAPEAAIRTAIQRFGDTLRTEFGLV